MIATIGVIGYHPAMSALAFDTFSAARALEAAGVERPQAEAIAGAIAAQAVTRADLEPLATKAELRILQWVVGNPERDHARYVRYRRVQAALAGPLRRTCAALHDEAERERPERAAIGKEEAGGQSTTVRFAGRFFGA